MEKDKNVNVIVRAFKILEKLFENGEAMGVSAVAAAADLPKSSTFRILSTLAECGAVTKNDENLYQLGLMFIRYGELVRSNISLNTLAEPLLLELRDLTQEAVNLAVLYHDYVVNLLSYAGESFIITSRVLPISPLHCSSSGKIFLAYMEEEAVRAYFAIPRKKHTVHTITNYDQFVREKQNILRSGISFDHEEFEYGLYCVGAPIFGYDEQPVAAISISGPISRMKMKNFDWLAEQVSLKAEALSGLLREAQLL